MMKIDLDDLERKAQAAGRGALSRIRWFTIDDRTVCWSPTIDGKDTCMPQGFADTFDIRDTAHIAANSPPVTLALIARIRELEGEVNRGAALLEAHSDMGARRSWAADLRTTVAKGVVLP